jgi:rhodanese-related sulfurtransferase
MKKENCMKKAIMLLIFIPLMLWSQGKVGSSSEISPYVNYEELKSLMENDSLLLIDVRTEGEYNSGHIPGAINIPYDTMPDTMPEGSKEKQIVVYCRSGNRSGTARGILTRAGYENLKDFGGIGNWKDALE